MSNSVDQRIVQMQFDNAQFEQGVATTMKSLQNLDKQLELKNGIKGFENIDKAAAQIDFSGMEGKIGRIQSLFASLGDMASTALGNIGAKITDIAANVVQGVTIQPLTDGLGEYTTKLNSIQTIQANTLGKPNSSMRDITNTLDDLNKYADKTIYNFAEMTRNIGTFTAAGVGLQDSQVAIKGIANMAAASGASSYDASRAMYQLSQALAAGSLKLQDWNSVVNANMGGQLFQESLLATSDALKTGGRDAVQAAGSFRESLKSGWITQDVLTKTLRNFTLATNEMDEAQKKEAETMLRNEGYRDDQIAKIFEQANVAQEAATKVKTFEQLVDTTREALGSGWATTWEYIIGDLDQAKDLWTPIADRLGGIINAFSDARNDLLRVWSRGDEKQGWESGRQAILDGLKELVAIADQIVKPIADAWSSVFTAINPKDLIDASVAFREFAKSLRKSFEESVVVKAGLAVLQGVFTALFTVIKMVGMVVGGVLVTAFRIAGAAISAVAWAIETVARFIGSLINRIVQFAANGVDVFTRFADFLRKNTAIDKNLANIIESVDKIIQGFANIFSGKVAEGSEMVSKAVQAVSNNFGKFGDTVGKFISGKAKDFIDFLIQVRSNAPVMAAKAYGFLSEQFQKLQPYLQPIADGLGKIKDAFVGALDAFSGLTSGATFDQFFSQIGNAFASLNDITDLSQLQSLGEKIRIAFQNLFGSIGDQIKNFFSKFFSGAGIDTSMLDTLGKFFEDLGDKFNGVKDMLGAFSGGLVGDNPFGFIGDMMKSLTTVFKENDPEKVKAGVDGFKAVMDSITGVFDKIKMILGNPFEAIGITLANLANGIGSGIQAFTSKLDLEKIKEFVGTIAAFGISAGTVVALYNMGKALKGVGEILESLGDLTEVIEKVGKNFAKVLKAKAMQGYAAAFKSIAMAIAIMVGAAVVVALVGPDKVMSAIPVVLALVGLMSAVTILFGFLAKLDSFDFGGIVKVATAMLELSVAIGILAIAIAAFSAITGGSWTGILQIAVILGLIVAVSAVMSKIDTSGIKKMGSGMLQIAQSLLLMYGAMLLFASMDTATLVKGGAAVTALMLVVALISRIMGTGSRSISISSSGSSSMAKNILSIAATIFIVYEVIKGLSKIDEASLGKALKTLAFMALIMAALNYSMTEMGKMGKGGGTGNAATLLAMSVAIGVFAIAVGAMAFALSSGANVWGALAVIALGIGAMAGALALMGKFAPQLDGAAAAMLGMVVAVAAFTAVILVLSTVPWETILQGIVNVSMILGVFLLALLGIGAIGELVGVGLLAVGGAFVLFGVAMVAVAAALLIGVAAMAGFTAISGAFVPAFEKFTDALIKCFKTENFVSSMIGMSLAMALLGAACLILGVGLGVLSLALWAFGEVFPKAAETASTAITNMANFINQNKDAIASAVTSMLEAAVQAILNFGSNLLNSAKQIPNKISEGLKSNPDAISNGVKDIVGTIGRTFAETLPQVGGILLQLLGQIATGLFEGIAKAVTGPVEWLDHKLFELTNGLMGHSEAAQVAGDAIGTGVATGLTTATQTLGDPVKAKVDELIGDVVAKTPEAETASQGFGNAFTNPIEAIGGNFNFFDAVGLSPDILAQGGAVVKDFLGQQGYDLPLDLCNQFASGASGFDAWGMIESNGNTDMTQFTDLMRNTGTEGGEGFKLSFSNEMDAADIEALVANAANIDVDTLSEKMGEAGQVSAQAFATSFKESIEIDGTGPIDKAAAALKASTGSMESAGNQLGKSVGKGFDSGSKDMKSKGKAAGKAAVDATSGQASSAYTAGYNVGSNLGRGVAAGINAMLASVKAAADKIISEANRAANAAAKINSPSKVWMAIGHGLGEGLILGMDHMQSSVAEASAEMFDPAIALAMEQAGYLSGLLNDIDDQPTIRPVLDLTDYEAGINRMQGLNASAPLNSAQWANGRLGGGANGSYYNNNTNRSMVINLNYGAGTSAADMVNEMASILQTKNLMEA